MHAPFLNQVRQAHAQLNELGSGHPGTFEVSVKDHDDPVELPDFAINCTRLSRAFTLQTRSADLLMAMQRPDIRAQFKGEDGQTELQAIENLGASGLLMALGESTELLSKIAIAMNNEARHSIIEKVGLQLPDDFAQVHAAERTWPHHAEVVGPCSSINASLARTGMARNADPFEFTPMVWFSWSEAMIRGRVQESSDALKLSGVTAMMQRMKTENPSSADCVGIIEACMA